MAGKLRKQGRRPYSGVPNIASLFSELPIRLLIGNRASGITLSLKLPEQRGHKRAGAVRDPDPALEEEIRASYAASTS